jgi:predicted transcriptional regulator
MARARSISAKPKKRGRGRPATGRDPMIGLRLPKNAIARLDDWAKAMGCTRSELIRGLIEHGLSLRSLRRALVSRGPATNRAGRQER